jgi:hypothetical protein
MSKAATTKKRQFIYVVSMVCLSLVKTSLNPQKTLKNPQKTIIKLFKNSQKTIKKLSENQKKSTKIPLTPKSIFFPYRYVILYYLSHVHNNFGA